MIKFPKCPRTKDGSQIATHVSDECSGVLVPLGFSDQIFAVWKCIRCKYTLKS